METICKLKEKEGNLKKIISFTLYGDKELYNYGVLLNYELKKYIYKDWIIRLYINETINEQLLKYLKTLDIELFLVKNSKVPPMFFRFFPFSDPTVKYFISRDLDSIISFREEAMVDEWIKSNKRLHLIHEVYPGHRHIVMGGMFGFKNIHNDTNIYDGSSYFYKPWNSLCTAIYDEHGLKLVVEKKVENFCFISNSQIKNYKNGEEIIALWHGKSKKKCRLLKNKDIEVTHGSKSYTFEYKCTVKNNINDQILEYYNKTKKKRFYYGDDQLFLINYLKDFIPKSLDHNKNKEGTWDYSIKFDKIVKKLNSIFPGLSEGFIGNKIRTKTMYIKYFNKFSFNKSRIYIIANNINNSKRIINNITNNDILVFMNKSIWSEKYINCKKEIVLRAKHDGYHNFKTTYNKEFDKIIFLSKHYTDEHSDKYFESCEENKLKLNRTDLNTYIPASCFNYFTTNNKTPTTGFYTYWLYKKNNKNCDIILIGFTGKQKDCTNTKWNKHDYEFEQDVYKQNKCINILN